MAFPVIGAEGAVTSLGTGGNFYATLLSRMKPNEANISISADQVETTGFNTGANTYTPGIRSWGANINGHAFATPILGNQSVVAFSSGGYAVHVDSFTLNITAPAMDYTSLNTAVAGTAPTWRSFRPGASNWTATVNAKVDNSTAVVLPGAAGSSGATVTFTYQDDATDEALAGTAFIERVEVGASVGSFTAVTLSLRGTGALTPAGDGSPFGTTAFGVPLWSEGGSAVGAMVFTAYSGRTYTGADSFWKSLQLACNVGESVKLSVGLQGTGTMTIALYGTGTAEQGGRGVRLGEGCR